MLPTVLRDSTTEQNRGEKMLVPWMLLLGASTALCGRLGFTLVGGLFVVRVAWGVLRSTLLTP